MTDLTTRIMEILEAQQVEVTEISNERCEYRILGIATTAAKIMEAAKDAGFFWAYGDARCDSCDNGIMPDWKWCPYCAAPQSSNDAEFGTGDFRRPDAPVKSDASLSEALTEIRAGLAGIPFDSDAQISDAAPAREPSAPFLWCCHIRGPDDVLACETYEAALKMADDLNDVSSRINAQFPPDERVRYSAVPAPWPWSADTHAGDLKRQREGK